jgi:sirohydrochlorin ferrochelatase
VACDEAKTQIHGRDARANSNQRRRIILVDNGSVEPAGTLQLRRLAATLSARLGVPVEPVSLAHSTRVAPEALESVPAELFVEGLDRVLREGAREIVVLPLFIGPSHAIVRHVPALIAERSARYPDARIVLASSLAMPGDTRLAQILAENIRAQLRSGAAENSPARPVKIAIVDHGSPSRAVTEVRDTVTERVRALLGDEPVEVAACSMERRAGPEFEFNEPLLANLLAREGWPDAPLIVALMFIAPGKHAGPEGDVARIVAQTRGGAMGGVRFTPVMGTHPLLVEILVDRVNTASRADPERHGLVSRSICGELDT